MIYITKILRIEKIIKRNIVKDDIYELIDIYEIDYQNDEGIIFSDSFKGKDQLLTFLSECQFLTSKVVEIR